MGIVRVPQILTEIRMNTKQTRRTTRHATSAASMQQQRLKFEDDAELWQQLPEDRRRDVVSLLQKMLIQWRGRDSKGEQS